MLCFFQSELNLGNINLLEICFAKLIAKDDQTKKEKLKAEEQLEECKKSIVQQEKELKNLTNLVELMKINRSIEDKCEEELVVEEELAMEEELVVEEEEEEQQESERSLLLARTSTPAPKGFRSRSLRRIPEMDNDTSSLPDLDSPLPDNNSFVIDNNPSPRIVNSTMLDQSSPHLDTTSEMPDQIPFSPVPIHELRQREFNSSNLHFNFNVSRVNEINSSHNNQSQPNMNDHTSPMMEQSPLGLYLSSQNSSQMDNSRPVNNSQFSNFESSRMSFNNSQAQANGLNPSMPGHLNTSNFPNMSLETPNHNQTNYSQTNHNQTNHNQTNYSQTNHNQTNYSQTNYNQTNHNQTNHNQTNHNQTTEDTWLQVRNKS
jgi:hypothetical protein